MSILKNPVSPEVIGITLIPSGIILDIAVDGNYLYIIGYEQLSIIEITDPANPDIIGSLDLDYPTQTFEVAGNYVYVLSEFDLSIIDVADPSRPELIGLHYTEMWSTDLAIKGQFAYIAYAFRYGSMVQYGGMEIFDIKDPAAPMRVGGFGTNYPAYGVAADRHYAYLAAGEGLYSLDITNPNDLEMSGIFQPGYFFGDNLVVVSQYLYGINISRGLYILDISDPAAPQEAGFYAIDLRYLDWDMDVAGGYTFIADGPNGLVILRYTGDDWTFTSFEPAWGPAGTQVTLIGSRFGDATTVRFDGVAAAFSIESDETIKALVPPGATTGKITVETPFGFATSNYDFIVGNLNESSYFPVVER